MGSLLCGGKTNRIISGVSILSALSLLQLFHARYIGVVSISPIDPSLDLQEIWLVLGSNVAMAEEPVDDDLGASSLSWIQ